MRELNEYTAEVRRRVAAESAAEMECRTQRQHRMRILAACAPLVLCLILGAVVLPPLLRGAGPDTAAPSAALSGQDRSDSDAVAAGFDAAAGQREQDGVEGEWSGPADDGTLPLTDGCIMSEVPADFSFRFVWGCYGISSYDSETGRLVKTTDATHPEDYAAELFLTDGQRQEVWTLLSGLALETYPEQYDPYNAPDAEQRVASEPSRDLILTLRANGQETAVTCLGICLEGAAGGYDEKAQAFLDACDRLTELLTGTPEWKALPEYEFFYD